MKIGMLSPIAWRTPPRHYGPWENVVSLLTEALVKRGVDVTLFATRDSLTSARLQAICKKGYEEDRSIEPKVWECLHISEVFEHAGEFDLIHNNFDFLPLTYSGLISTPVITTIHGFSSPEIYPVYQKYNDSVFYVSISKADRLDSLDYVANVYHGIDISQFTFQPRPGEYLLFFGRIHIDKGAGEAGKGTKIQLKDESGKLLASLLLGKPRESGGERSFPDGHYVTLDNDPTIYLIDTHFAHLQKKPSDWLDKALLKVEANEVKKISSLSADGKTINYTFGRAEKGNDLEPTSLPAKKKVDKSALNRLARSLSSLSMEDVIDPSDDSVSIDLKKSNKVEYHLFNGMIYSVYPGKACPEDGQCYLKVEVDYQKPSAEEKPAADEKASNDEKTSPEKTSEEIDLEAKQLNKRLSPWVYVISKWQHDSFVTDLDKLLEKPDKTRAKKNG